MSFLLAVFTGLFLVISPSHATLRPSDVPGRELVQHKVSSGWFKRETENCVIPDHLPNASYSQHDEQLERYLCDLNIDKNVAACPKTNSTNPGVNFVLPPEGMSLKELTGEECEVPGAKKIAKYKLSVSCSYSPGILAYYHVSRALGHIVNVPPSVLRTMNVKRHQDLAERALVLLADKPGEKITGWWNLLKTELENGSRSERADQLFTENFDQSWGALSENPLGEIKYDEFNNKAADRVQEFKSNNPIYAAVSNPSTRVAREFTLANVQRMRQLKDAGDFILLDTLLNQQDRIGNIHYEVRYYSFSGARLLRSERPEMNGALPIKEMILKDNDCSVNKSPRIKTARLLDTVAHMDPATYRAFLRFASGFESSSTRDFFQRGLQFTDKDYRSVSTNVREAARLLTSRCQSGALALDLDMESHFSGARAPDRGCGY